MTLISLLMATEISRPIWAIVPKLREVQFPWRWLGITSMFASILLASEHSALDRKNKKQFPAPGLSGRIRAGTFLVVRRL